jgi:hypothetical protein
MKPTALRIAKGSRRHGRCGRCRLDVTWATLAHRGTKNITLVVSPLILRVEHGANGVSVEIIAFDQVHRCPKLKLLPRVLATNPMAVRHVPKRRPADHAYASFTPDRLADLKARLASPAPPKPPAPPLEKRW